MRSKIILAGIGIAIIIAVFLASSYSFIAVEIEGSEAPGESTVILWDQQNARGDSITTRDSTLKRLVRRGTYEVSVERGNESYFAIQKVGGFFSTTNVTATLQSENLRTFIGNNPNACAYYIENRLFSSACEEPLNLLNMHVPATASQPTYTTTIGDIVTDRVEAIITTPAATMAMVKAPESEEHLDIAHAAYQLDANGTVSNGVALAALRPLEAYGAVEYKDGLIAYGYDNNHVVAYESLQSQPQELIVTAKERGVQMHSVSTWGEGIAVMYSTDTPPRYSNLYGASSATHDHSDTESNDNSELSEVIVMSGTTTNHYTFGGHSDYIKLCGPTHLCRHSDDSLEIYSLNNGEAQLSSRIRDVAGFEVMGSTILIAHRDGVISFNIQSNSGYLTQNFGDYDFCGFRSVSKSSYLLCLVDTNNNRTMLLVDTQNTNIDSIDKKIADLRNTEEVKDISVYRSYIFIAPELGQVEYDESTGYFGYSASTRSPANAAIQKRIDELGIDRARYTIVNTLQ